MLASATSYTCGMLGRVRDGDLDRQTPCEHWDLAELLGHMEDSLLAFTEAVTGSVAIRPPVSGRSSVEPVRRLRTLAGELLGAWEPPPTRGTTRIGTAPMATSLVAAAGALEIAVHGWDVGEATGGAEAIPAALAGELLAVAPVLIGPHDRGVRFAAARPIVAGANESDRLLALAGRRPTPRR
nr:TIGR03086 family metal-binding protein [Flexivirga meconopsidis]